MAALNENIRMQRAARGISQVEFADRLGVTKQCVSNWENDNVLPSIEMLTKLADFFGVTTDFLLGREPVSPISTVGLTPAQIVHLQTVADDMAATNAEIERVKLLLQVGRIHDPRDRS